MKKITVITLLLAVLFVSQAFAQPAFLKVCDKTASYRTNINMTAPLVAIEYYFTKDDLTTMSDRYITQECAYVPNQEMIDLLKGGGSSSESELNELLKQQIASQEKMIASQQELIDLLKQQLTADNSTKIKKVSNK